MVSKIVLYSAILSLFMGFECRGPVSPTDPITDPDLMCVQRVSGELTEVQFQAFRSLTLKYFNPGMSATDRSSTKENRNIGQISQPLTAVRDDRWGADQDLRIKVCWHAYGYKDQDQHFRQKVREAVSLAWESALVNTSAEGVVNTVLFSGWEKCDFTDTNSIKIKVSDTSLGAYTTAVGKKLGASDQFMYLNFTFNHWSEDCTESPAKVLECIGSTAVHEFGHALGVTHEQNRFDTSMASGDKGISCGPEMQSGTVGDTNLGPWDAESVMNYCNHVWNNAGILSELDRVGVKNFYYPTRADEFCGPFEFYQQAVENY